MPLMGEFTMVFWCGRDGAALVFITTLSFPFLSYRPPLIPPPLTPNKTTIIPGLLVATTRRPASAVHHFHKHARAGAVGGDERLRVGRVLEEGSAVEGGHAAGHVDALGEEGGNLGT